MNASASSPVRDFRDAGIRVLRIDPLMLLATLGLIAASIYTVGTASQDDIPGDPNYYAYRQALYAGVGLVFMFLLSRFDYSRLREWKIGIYAFMIVADPGRLRARLLCARLAAGDRVRLLQLPGVGARQAAARRDAVGLHGRPHAAPDRS